MRVECKHYESRTYPNGDTVRKCGLDLAPEAPWRCPDDCPRYERRLASAGWHVGSVAPPKTPEEPEAEGIAELFASTREVLESALPDAIAERERAKKPRWRRFLDRRDRG